MKKLIPALALLMLSACGFHLKGTQGAVKTLPFQNWYLAGGNVLQQPLAAELQRADAKLVQQSDAQAEITVTGISARRDIYTITRAATVNEYLLVLQIDAQASVKGKPFGKPMKITVHRTLDYADSEVLGKAEEEQTVWNEMYQDAAQQMVTRIMFMKAE